MAAQPSFVGVGGSHAVELIDLRSIRAGGLDAILDQERQLWLKELHWDFSPSASLVQRFVDMRSLAGRALLINSEIAGYTYTVTDGARGLIGDLFLQEKFRTQANENLLLDDTVRALVDSPGIRRIESQILLLEHPRPALEVMPDKLRVFPRHFMACKLPAKVDFPINPMFTYSNWEQRQTEAASELINEAYDGHVDSQLNDQYRSLPGARLFLQNIVNYPGCGTFLNAASFVARSHHTGRVLGICLVSRVSPSVGHITQLCVAPDMQGRGIGRSLLQLCFDRLEVEGCTQVSLTVTSANAGAVTLYARCGFTPIRNFAAYVWEGFRPTKRFL